MNPSLFIHISPRLDLGSLNKNQVCCNYDPSIKSLINNLNSNLTIIGIAVFVDCFSLNFFRPHDFPDGIPTVAIIGDTHHGGSPILPLFNWLSAVKISTIILKQTISQFKLFESLGFKVFAFPYYLHNPRFLDPSKKIIPRALFCGSLSANHNFRRNILSRLENNSVPIDIVTCTRDSSYELYNKYAISLNIPLGLDINYRHHEIIASGGFLLTEMPNCQAIKYMLLKPGRNYGIYTSYSDLVEKIYFYINNPQVNCKIRQISHSLLKNEWQSNSLFVVLMNSLDQKINHKCQTITRASMNIIADYEARQYNYLAMRNKD